MDVFPEKYRGVGACGARVTARRAGQGRHPDLIQEGLRLRERLGSIQHKAQRDKSNGMLSKANRFDAVLHQFPPGMPVGPAILLPSTCFA
jgi:hypothetical protein